MTPEEKEALRDRVLLTLFDSAPAAQPAKSILLNIRSGGMPRVIDHDIERAVSYLSEKGLLAETTAELSAGLKRYRITAAGSDYLEGKGLA